MTKIRTSDVKHTVTAQAAAELAAAAGNSLISKEEQKTLAPELQRAVDDVRRAGGSGTRVTVAAAKDAFAARATDSIDAVNQGAGSGKAWLSKAEIAALQQRDPAVGERAGKAWDILAGRTTPAPAFDAAAFTATLDKALSFQFESSFGSEGGQPMSAVRAAGPFTTLDAATFKAAFGFTGTTPDDKVERDVAAAGILQELTASVVQPVYSAQQEQDARTIATLIGSLKDARAFVMGEDGTTNAVHPTFIVGLAPDGSMVGVKTGVVWT